MFKRTEESGTTKQLRKTKLIDSYKNISKQQQTLVHRPGCSPPSRIMLADLCPEQKAKIGDLVKTLEVRKKQNKTLEQKNNLIQLSQAAHIKQIQQLEKTVIEQSRREGQLLQEINQLKIQGIRKEQEISYLKDKVSEYQKKILDKERAMVDQFSMTNPVFTNQQGCQVVPKRKKQKERQSQTEEVDYHKQRTRKYPNNSKSFDRIMKNEKINKSSQKVSNQNTRNKNSRKKQSKIQSQIRISDQQNRNIDAGDHYWDEYISHEKYNDENEDQFDELAQKWLQLKEQNMSKIRQSYSRSRGKVDYQEEQPQEFEDNLNNYEEESFGPHRRDSHPTQNQEQFDEIQLNKILKSKNFSASRLLHSNMNNREGSSSRLKSQQSAKKRLIINDKSKVINNAKNKLQNNNTSSNSRNIDFYETDLLDLVSSINPQ